jgi:hypothetical protein
MVAEILQVLALKPGDLAVDCTLGYGGHAQEILAKLLPGGKLLGLDQDPLQLPKTEARLWALGFDGTVFTAHRSNFAGLPKVFAANGIPGADIILADVGVSSMQIDDRQLLRMEAILNSMTVRERLYPSLLNGSRRRRIADGSGTTVQEVNKLIKQYLQTRKLMKGFSKGKMKNAGRLLFNP